MKSLQVIMRAAPLNSLKLTQISFEIQMIFWLSAKRLPFIKQGENNFSILQHFKIFKNFSDFQSDFSHHHSYFLRRLKGMNLLPFHL